MKELRAPHAAAMALLDVLVAAHRAGATGETLTMNSPPDVRAVATPVVVAELRRLAQERATPSDLWDRADQLEGKVVPF